MRGWDSKRDRNKGIGLTMPTSEINPILHCVFGQ